MHLAHTITEIIQRLLRNTKMNEPNENVTLPFPHTLSEGNCVICRNPLDGDKQKVYNKGLETLLRISRLRGDDELHNYLLERSLTSPIGNVYVHKIKRCRAEYTDLREIVPMMTFRC